MSPSRIKALRKRVQASNEARTLSAGKPTWFTHERFTEAVKAFKAQVGDPPEHLGQDWESFFLPWEAMIAGYPADMRADFERHQAEDAREFNPPSWSFGEMVTRQHVADHGAAYSGIE
ncbi:hypothetical protein DVA43_02505 [Leclercia sp. W6]|uniref:hypothetical protein n=1 Tax=Leclercia sp. W6 TaxID=2282310 RepID=UPI000DF21803|nr:hypothetical protein [Leclercia sp. W6]AXF58506.1 hypothetical protein DVA43_02505 [Leclercia sp. W6]